jgi:dienelactone hydrolase
MKATPRKPQWTDYTPAVAAGTARSSGERPLVEITLAFLTRGMPQAKAYLIAPMFFGLVVTLSVCQTDSKHEVLPPGQVESVTCSADPTQSYSLYLPSTYTPAKRWPMIYLFDPGGRGRRPVELYKESAEKYGYILAGSNNSRNFSPDPAKNVNAIWLDTHMRLALDEHRTYTSGFSGGARVAGAMALGCAQCQIAGVIAHGAGYPNNQPKSDSKLLYFFAVGDQDFNWPEVIGIWREGEEKGLPYRVRVFPGPHQWAPAAVMEDAVEWLMLRAMQSGDLTADATFVDRLYRQRREEAEDAERKNDAALQLMAYRSLVSDFSRLKDVTEPEKKLALLKKSVALKDALKNEQEQIAEQSALESDISPKVDDYVNGSAPDSGALRTEILQAMGGLRDQAAHSKKEATRLVTRRALDGLFVTWMETGQKELESRHFEKAELCFELMSQVKDDPWPVLLLAETHATAGSKKLAIKDLKEAVKRGLSDPGVIESEAKFQTLRADAEFQKLVEQLKHK